MVNRRSENDICAVLVHKDYIRVPFCFFSYTIYHNQYSMGYFIIFAYKKAQKICQIVQTKTPFWRSNLNDLYRPNGLVRGRENSTK
jgi:hypothetical protein